MIETLPMLCWQCSNVKYVVLIYFSGGKYVYLYSYNFYNYIMIHLRQNN